MGVTFRHLVSTEELSRADVDAILKVAKDMEGVLQKGGDDRLKGKILASLFYEPSTRTRLSFESAMRRLGGNVITADGLQFSSMYKGETIEDTIRVVGQYSDIIAMRHPEEGSAGRAAKVSPVPFINAGDGPGQHPTQALLDLYTIQKERGQIDGLTIAMVGDLKYGRTVRSLTYFLALFENVRLLYVSPAQLRIPENLRNFLVEKKIRFEEMAALEDALDAHVIYMTRIQKERFEDQAEYEKLKDSYILTTDHLLGKTLTVMHPLPRVNEIALDVDQLPIAAYFRQAGNGIPVRMAILALLLEAA